MVLKSIIYSPLARSEKIVCIANLQVLSGASSRFSFSSGGVSQAEIVARCGQGYLETIDGYRVLHLKGTPYEMGYQQGTLLNDDCKSLFTYLFDGKLKEKKIEYLGIQVPVKQAVAAIFAAQRPNIPERYIEEMQGIADALHIDAQTVFAANSIPEFFHCSGFALLGEITQTGNAAARPRARLRR